MATSSQFKLTFTINPAGGGGPGPIVVPPPIAITTGLATTGCIANIPEFEACIPIAVPIKTVPQPPGPIVIVPDTKPWLGGNFWLLSSGGVGDFWTSFSSSHPSLSNAAFDGVRGRTNWAQIEPSRGVYNFSGIKNVADLCLAAGKRLSVSIGSGIATPDHVYDTGAPVTRFPIDTNGDDINDGIMPLSFQQSYLDKWDVFVAKCGLELDGHLGIGACFFGGLGQQVMEFHVTKSTQNELDWNSAATAAGFADKSDALRFAIAHVMASTKAAFPNTALLFTQGNPWGGGDAGKADEDFAENTSIASPNCGICNSFLHAMTEHTGIPNKVNYPHGFQPIFASTDQARFYEDPQPDPYPDAPIPIYDLLESAFDKGAQYCEIYNYDASLAENQSTLVSERPRLISNLS